MQKPVVIGVTGGTGSGKTTVASRIVNSFPEQQILVIEQDSYYKDQSHLSFEERVKTNYDHPFAFDNDLFIKQLGELLNYNPIEKPIYDFKVHNRKVETKTVHPADVIMVEGILILEDKRLRDLMDIKIFVDTDADVRFIRRLTRDIKERGRTIDSVINQYLSVVRPMHLRFIEPTKRYADIIVPEGGENHVAVDLLVTKVRTILEQRRQK